MKPGRDGDEKPAGRRRRCPADAERWRSGVPGQAAGDDGIRTKNGVKMNAKLRAKRPRRVKSAGRRRNY